MLWPHLEAVSLGRAQQPFGWNTNAVHCLSAKQASLMS